MNILMFTNTYLPHVGGVARSVHAFAAQYRRAGHNVLIVAPEYEGGPAPDEPEVVRIPAIQNFNGSDFSVRLPLPAFLFSRLNEFRPDIVHAHHPFLLGDTALRTAAKWNVPIVFTHHTMYERYTHYVPGHSRTLRRFAMRLVTGYCNLCHHVIAPSESIMEILREREVLSPVTVIPTGVDVATFASGDRSRLRTRLGIPRSAFVVGHVGRLAPEKNLAFLGKALRGFLLAHPGTHALIVGEGPSEVELKRLLGRHALRERVHLPGSLSGQELVDAYHAMDVFAFSSLTETQGMVLTEAMAAGLPVIALDAPGAREVVRDGENGRLLMRHSVRDFAQALDWFYRRTEAERGALRNAAAQTAAEFSIERCAAKALELYSRVIAEEREPVPDQNENWEALLRLTEAEWQLLVNRTNALTKVIHGAWRRSVSRLRLGGLRRSLKRLTSRAEWSAKFLRLGHEEARPPAPGLVLLQIDGLSRRQLELALRSRKMPFLRRLISREGYELRSLYSGLPSTTPAVQGELFYGEKCIVPAFSFLDHNDRQRVRMFEPTPAAKVEAVMSSRAEGLLKGGSCYSSIYTGQAAEPHFCPAAFGWQGFLSGGSPLRVLSVFLWHFWSIVRTTVLLLVELGLSITDALFSAASGKELMQEIKFIPSRVAICIGLREMITAGAVIDVTRGLPVIMVNFLGYDEQAHRRGPRSRFAHWSLRGIDDAIRRIWETAGRSQRRLYQVWIFSDHGQEHTTSYLSKTGKTVEQAIRELFGEHPIKAAASRYEGSTEFRRATWLGGRLFQQLLRKPLDIATDEEQLVNVAAMGPIGHVYYRDQLSDEQKREYAERMVNELQIPLVLSRLGDGVVHAWNSRGEWQLPRDAAVLFDNRLPYFAELAADMHQLCCHEDAGEFIISGWRKEGLPMSFPLENGAHAGPGSEETHAFALLPKSPFLAAHRYLRPRQLREQALRVLRRTEEVTVPIRTLPVERRIRVMTYNVHSCVGTDGKLSTYRIAEVISRYNPDIVCLQELDAGRLRTAHADQAEEIARELEMDFYFHPALALEKELYGDAILSRLPMRLRKTGALPGLVGRPELEPRGALWVEILAGGVPLQVFNTHFGLLRAERDNQLHELLGPRWLGGVAPEKPLVLCGDLNVVPGSRVYRLLSAHLRDVQCVLESHGPRNTWSALLPVGRIDHIFISDQLDVAAVFVPRNDLTKRASDHLPLVADLVLPALTASAGGAHREEAERFEEPLRVVEAVR